MSNSSKWTVYRSLMVAITIIFVIVRIFLLLYYMNNTPSQFLLTQLFQVSVEVLFLGILIFIPRKYRMVAMIPLLYFMLGRGAQIINLITTSVFNELPILYAIQYTVSNLIYLITYLTYLILLLPIFKYRMKHFYIASFFIIPIFLLYVLNIFQNSRYIGNTLFSELLLFSVVFNFVTYFSFPVAFALYILNDVHTVYDPIEEMN